MSNPARPRRPGTPWRRTALLATIAAFGLAGCGGGEDAGVLDLTKTPPAAPEPPVKGRPATQPLDTTPN